MGAFVHLRFDAEHTPAGGMRVAAVFRAAIEALHGVVNQHREKRGKTGGVVLLDLLEEAGPAGVVQFQERCTGGLAARRIKAGETVVVGGGEAKQGSGELAVEVVEHARFGGPGVLIGRDDAITDGLEQRGLGGSKMFQAGRLRQQREGGRGGDKGAAGYARWRHPAITLNNKTGMNPLAVKKFTEEDQRRFAALSGDYNPMHVDTLRARRTQAGAPVVHGIHTLLWCLEQLAAAVPDLPPIGSLKARFSKLVYVGDRVVAAMTQRTERGCNIDASIDGSVVCRIALHFGEPAPAAEPLVAESVSAFLPEAPRDASFGELEGAAGRVGFASTEAEVREAFPAACRMLSPKRVQVLLATTTLVGMVCPGLHSMFGGLTVSRCVETARPAGIDYRVVSTDERFRMVRMEIVGTGLRGAIESFARMPPAKQAGMREVAGLVPRDAFAGTTALVIGGSRGLGEVAAKLLAAGGARVMITYARGRADAEAVAEEIRTWGGDCAVMPYDVCQDAGTQLAGLPAQPTHLYYFATPPIFRRKAELFVAERLRDFLQFYVTGFYDIFRVLYAGSGHQLIAFYPSSTAVETRPGDMTEDARAKMAGEVLCADLAAQLPGAQVVINRLPRLPTDQTASLVQAESADPVQTLLPILLAMQSRPAGSLQTAN